MYGKCTRYRVKGIPGVKDRSFDALQDAKTWLAQAQTDARRGEFVDPRDGAISLKDYIETSPRGVPEVSPYPFLARIHAGQAGCSGIRRSDVPEETRRSHDLAPLPARALGLDGT
jgi:hypothetical protein